VVLFYSSINALVKIFDNLSLGTRFVTCFWSEPYKENIKKALEVAFVCDHPNAVWLAKLFAGCDVTSDEEARRVFLGFENDPRAVCFASVLIRDYEEILRAAELGDAFAQAWMARKTDGEESFRWAEKSSGQGERDSFNQLGHCCQHGIGCLEDAERSKENFLAAAELGYVDAMVRMGQLFDKDDPQRFVWFGRAVAANGYPFSFLNEMIGQIRNFNSGTGHASVVFAIGRALKGHINYEERTHFGDVHNFEGHIGQANQALHFYEFQLQSYRKAVDSWTIVGLKIKL
jgi:TPR repeat protein